MTHTKIKSLLNSAIDSVSSSVYTYAVNPGKDFSRNRKLPPDKLIRFLIAEGSSTTKNELLDFFGMSSQSPSSSAFFQQREKLKPEALKEVFDNFTKAIPPCADKHPGYRLIAADGSTASFLAVTSILHPMNISFLRATPSRAHIAFISTHFRIWTRICIQMLCYSQFTVRMSFEPSAPLLTDIPSHPALRISTSATEAIARITTWPMSSIMISISCSEQRTSIKKGSWESLTSRMMRHLTSL